MTQKIQVGKNIVLSEELASFIVENPNTVNKLPESATFVIFTEKDTQLNEANKKLLNTLIGEGKSVVRAQKTNDPNHQWVFTSV